MPRRLKSLMRSCAFMASLGLASPVLSGASDTPKFQPMVDEAAPKVRSLTVNGLSVIFQPVVDDAPGDDTLAGERRPLTVYTAVMAEGLTPVIIASNNFPPDAAPVYAVVKLDATDPVPSLLVQTYSGGAHCCADYIAVTPVNDALKAVPIGFFNGGPLEDAPTDLDGDGRVDIAVRDDRFLYEFAPYYASWAPPMFLNMVDGEVVDVSTRPAFRKALDAYAAKALKSCADTSEKFRNGACAVYVGIKARQGAYAQALKRVSRFINREELDFLPVACSADTGGGPCPDDMDIRFEWFEDALDYHLKRIGYLESSRP